MKNNINPLEYFKYIIEGGWQMGISFLVTVFITIFIALFVRAKFPKIWNRVYYRAILITFGLIIIFGSLVSVIYNIIISIWPVT